MYFPLRSLSDRDLLSHVRSLTSQEREFTLQVLLHLNEIERRKLHLKQGYASMFDYCTSGLGYASSAAARRIRAARCVARFPGVYDLLKANEVSVSTVSQVSRILNVQNQEVILKRIRGKSQREVDAIVAEYQPLSMVRDVIRPVVVRAPAVSDGTAVPVPKAEAGVTGAAKVVSATESLSLMDTTGHAPATPDACEKSAYCRSGSAVPDTRPSEACHGGKGGASLALERRTLLQFSAGDAFMAKLEKVRSLAWHRLPANASLEQVFAYALDLVIEREDPSMRRERREKRASLANKHEPAGVRRESTEHPRHISASVRDEVFTRDSGRCTFVATNGRRCESRQALQVDHVVPVARGGPSTPGNLRLLCAYHNRLESERMLGMSPSRGSARNGP
jgi:5-methylcytosine-specific restriction endonuclease McrA